jgi:hypothetical protein
VTLTEAEERWIAAKGEEKRIKAELETAGDVLKEWFRKSGKQRRGKIAYAYSVSDRLDTKAVRAHLGDDIEKFLVPTPSERLSLLP